MAARIYILMGAPGSGKSALFKTLDQIPNFQYQIIQKITTRRPRNDDGEEIASVNEKHFVQVEPTESILSFVKGNNTYYSYNSNSKELSLIGPMYFNEKIALINSIKKGNSKDKKLIEKLYREANSIPEKYDFVYEQYTLRYGLSSDDIRNCLNKNKSAIIIVNDIRTIQDLKNYFGDLVVSIFIFRNLEAQDIEAMQKSRGATDSTGNIDDEQTKKRINKVNVIFRSYIENINLFTHVIINTTTYEDIVTQMKEIVFFYQKLDALKMINANIQINA